MAFLPGLKKQLNKANQFMSERISGVEGTKLDDEFSVMERRTDLFNEMVEDLQAKTREYLQPNPTVRAKMAAVKGISKLSGQAKASTYPQPEGTLGDAMCMYGRKMQEFDNTSIYAASMIEMGESMKQMADLKYALDDAVKQNYLEPLHHTQTKDLKEVLHHRKKLQGRKLDFDCKKRVGARDEEVKQAEEKFAESLQLAQLGMHNLLDGSGVEHISQLTQFSEGLLEYHKNCAVILQELTDKLYEKTNEVSTKPTTSFKPKTLEDLGVERNGDISTPSNLSLGINTNNSNNNSSSKSPLGTPIGTPTHDAWSGMGARGATPSPRASPTPSPTRSRPSCQALYDFDAEKEGELSFKEGDIIMLKSQIDENWFDGSLNGQNGYFPINYVSIIVPLPK